MLPAKACVSRVVTVYIEVAVLEGDRLCCDLSKRKRAYIQANVVMDLKNRNGLCELESFFPQPSYSSEDLNQEMANLEGLMKDLNAITASEFDC